MAKSERRYHVGFDLGGTKMLAVVYDEGFQPVARKRRRTRGHEGQEAGLARVANTIRNAVKASDIDTARIASIGVGCAGTLDLDRGVLLEAANLGWTNAPLKDALEEEFGCPVMIVNDVDAGVYGEYRFGAGRNARCVVGVFPGTGIGGGCVYEGRILRGRRSSCMEVGFMKIVSDSPPAGLGPSGILEGAASRLAVSAAAAQAAYRGQAPELRKLAGTDLSEIRGGVLARAIDRGDKVIERIVRRSAEFVGIAVGNLVNLLAPDVIVLGGGLVEAMPKLYVTAARESARETAIPSMHESFTIEVAELGDDAAVMGAAAWAFESLD